MICSLAAHLEGGSRVTRADVSQDFPRSRPRDCYLSHLVSSVYSISKKSTLRKKVRCSQPWWQSGLCSRRLVERARCHVGVKQDRVHLPQGEHCAKGCSQSKKTLHVCSLMVSRSNRITIPAELLYVASISRDVTI